MAFDVYLQCPEDAGAALAKVAITLRNLCHRTWLDEDDGDSTISLTVLSAAFFERSSAEERLELLKRPQRIGNEAFEAALRAARHSLVAQGVLRVWPRLKPLSVHCYSPLVFDERPSVYRHRSAPARRLPLPPRPAPPRSAREEFVVLPRPHVLETVVLKADWAHQGLRRGSVGIVAAHQNGVLDVEFGIVAGTPRVRLSLDPTEVEAAEACVHCGKVWGDADWGAFCRECSGCGHQDLSNPCGGLTL